MSQALHATAPKVPEMSAKSLVDQLLEEISVFGRTPEEACADYPELLSEVRRRWRRMCAIEGELDALFPVVELGQGADMSASEHSGGFLPEIPGYDVEALLGRGGMGVVYKARHRRLNRHVALKMLITGAHAGPAERARFQGEAEAVASLRHPNIIAVYDVGDHDSCPYFTMELLERGTLAQALAGTPKSGERAAALLIALSNAVQVAHDAGIIHRDLKPANILFTADGTPKVADFGLARHFEGAPELTWSGARIGTPSYMAPEQVIGKPGSIGPAADIYALGALLYEVLTGRPPFRGETATDTQRQVVHDEPVLPSRLNSKVPRDLETICLKCLSKEPQRRYASAAALGDDLKRFEEGRPIQARHVNWAQRLWRWCRRNPTAAALLATAVALVALAGGGGMSLVHQAAQHELDLRNGVSAALPQTVSLRKQYHFREARKLLEFAKTRLEPSGPRDLRQQVDQCRDDLELAARLDAARIKSATVAGGLDAMAATESDYVSAFAGAGLGRYGDNIKTVAARVRDSSLSVELIAALDDWASTATDRTQREWLLAVAREADGNPARNRLRRPALWTDPEIWKDPKGLEQVIADLKAADFSPQLATALSRAAREFHVDSTSLLAEAQTRYPADFWLNVGLGAALYDEGRWDEAIGFLRASLAIRPDVSTAYSNLGAALYAKDRNSQDRRDEAIGYFQEALRVDPTSATAHSNLGSALGEMGPLDDAIGHFEQALRVDPKSAATQFNLGTALIRAKGRLDEAIDHLQQAVSINPKFAGAHYNLGLALHTKGRLDEAIGHFEEALRISPGFAGAHSNLGNALADKGRLDEAIGHFEQALRIDPNSAIAHNNLGTALGEKGRLEAAIGHFEQALRIEPKFAPAHKNLRSALYVAASDAVRAAAGQGSGSERLGEPERADKRRQALAWLRADLALMTRSLGDGKLSEKSVAPWQTDIALASVRDPAELAKLPDAEREQWQRMWVDISKLVSEPMSQGPAFAARRDWPQAAACYARALTRDATDDGHFWYEYAALLLLSGDRPGYVKACAHMVDRCGKEKGPRSYHVARACTLEPHSVADMSLPRRLAEKELQGSREFWSLTEQGALAYRAGRFEEAVPLFEQSLRANPKPGAAVVSWLWLSLAHQRLGKAKEARRWLNTAQAWLDQYRDGMPPNADDELGLHLHNWLEAHVLRLEAESLINSEARRDGS